MSRKHVKIPKTTTKPIKIKSDKELSHLLEKIVRKLDVATDTAWKISVAALQELQGLTLGGAMEFPCYRSHMKMIANPFCNVLKSARSTVVKEACVTLAVIAEAMVRASRF